MIQLQVESANPLDGICTELADKYDGDYTQECTLKDLVQFLDDQRWFGANEVEIRKKLAQICGEVEGDSKLVNYRDVLSKLIS